MDVSALPLRTGATRPGSKSKGGPSPKPRPCLGEIEPSLSPLQALTEDGRKRVNTVIAENLGSEVAEIPKITDHLRRNPGKMLRPTLVLASCALCRYQGERHIPVAAAIELVHTATLLHDDVVDSAERRRGFKSANRIWGNALSVLVGDFLFARAFEMMTASAPRLMLESLAEAGRKLAEGEVLQRSIGFRPDLDDETYLRVISAKTGALFETAAVAGPAFSELNKTDRREMAGFGLNLGIAFQITDDILDYRADAGVWGKQVGLDFAEGQATLPVLLAWRQAGKTDRQQIENLFASPESRGENNFPILMEILNRYQAFDRALDTARRYAERAYIHLACFVDSPARRALEQMLAFILVRTR